MILAASGFIRAGGEGYDSDRPCRQGSSGPPEVFGTPERFAAALQSFPDLNVVLAHLEACSCGILCGDIFCRGKECLL